MADIGTERVLAVQHWTDTQFTFSTTRARSMRFDNGQFVMVGLMLERPLLRAYSIASANHADHLEFLSIKVPDGPLTSRLQHLQPGDEILVSRKPTGTLLLADLRPGARRLYLLCTGTGAAPFLSIIQDPELYARFAEVILVHGVRWARETEVVRQRIGALRKHELLGELVRNVLRYYPTVTREPHANRGRLTTLLESGRLLRDLRLPPLDAAVDRLMVCGSPALLTDVCGLLDARGFTMSPRTGEPGDYVTERAFVTRAPRS